MIDTDKANAFDWLNEIAINPDGWKMFYSDSETKACAEAALDMLKEQEERIKKFELERSWDEHPDTMGKW